MVPLSASGLSLNLKTESSPMTRLLGVLGSELLELRRWGDFSLQGEVGSLSESHSDLPMRERGIETVVISLAYIS